MTTEELSLFPTPPKRVKAAIPLAQHQPVAAVLIDNSLPHLDRLFDYSVPAKFAETALPGVRVRVRFAGKLIDGYLIERKDSTDHPGTLLPISVVSPEQVLGTQLFELISQVAVRNAGARWDVARTAIPHRHARAEGSVVGEPAMVSALTPELLNQYAGGPALVKRTIEQQAPRAIMPTGSDDVPTILAEYASAVAASEQSVILLVPDRAGIDRVLKALAHGGVPKNSVAVLAADDGAEIRYRNWVSVLRGSARIIVGTRSAVFAPAQKLAAICIWDDWNETFLEPHAPYWHAREVAVLRSQNENTALLILGSSPSTDAVSLMPWLALVARPIDQARRNMARVRSALEEQYVSQGVATRMPHLAFQVISTALKTGPVLVSVPRTGYSPRLVCNQCRSLAVCSQCAGALIQTARSSAPTCRVCGHMETQWSCDRCKGTQVRATTIGSVRTAEELGRAFPGIPVRSSSADHIVRSIDPRPSIVVATPGAAPQVDGGYSAAVFLDGNMMLSRPDLRAGEDTFSKWMECASAVRTDGEIVVVADPEHPAVQALIRHDPIGFAQRELAQRTSVELPPAVRLAVLTGAQADIDDLLAIAQLPETVLHRGPVPADPGVRLLLSVERAHGLELAQALKDATAVRSARKKGEPVNVRFDPYDL